jgi:hypothetical protein
MPPAPDGRIEPVEVEPPGSSVSLFFSPGSSLTIWSVARPSVDTDTECRLEIEPHHPVVIGRSEGREVPYLDPAYRPTRFVPGTGQAVVQSDSEGPDTTVSRGHFLLRAHPDGVILLNGVPRRAGGVRPPTNWTQLRYPESRLLEPAEEYLIGHGRSAVFRLPNRVEIRIEAR